MDIYFSAFRIGLWLWQGLLTVSCPIPYPVLSMAGATWAVGLGQAMNSPEHEVSTFWVDGLWMCFPVVWA